MRLSKKNISLLIFALFLLISYTIDYFKSHNQDVAGTKDSTPKNQIITPFPGFETKSVEYETVTKIVDGDTIKLSNGATLRYIGIDTPETVDPRQPIQCFGKEASQMNNQLVLGKVVALEKDVSDTDRYGRLLRYVYLSDGRMVNEILVEQGYAQASAYPPDIKYQEKLDELEILARNAQRGLWGSCLQ